MLSSNNQCKIKLFFGIPFYSMDFNEFTQTIGELVTAGGKHLFFTASLPWLLDYAKSPQLCPTFSDFILAADSNVISMVDKLNGKIKMPMEYFEFPEQVARICAHYGYSMLHVSEANLKTDILVNDGYVPLSWELFTHFKTAGELDDIDAQSITESANNSRPDIVLITAPPESIRKYLPAIYKKLHDCVVICIPQDIDRNKIEEKIDNVFSPLLLLREESKFQDQLKKTDSTTLSSSVNNYDSLDAAIIEISGTLNTQISMELIDIVNGFLEKGMDIKLDLTSTNAISLAGLETIYFLNTKARLVGKKISIQSVPESIQNVFHQAGLANYIENFPGIIDELTLE